MLIDQPIRSVRDQVLLLRSLPGFAPLDDDALALLAEHSRTRPVRAGERLLTLGEPIHHVYVVLAGKVRWRRKDRPENVAARHQVVGWITAMARDPGGLDAVADVDAVVLELPTSVLERALEQHFSLVQNLLRLGATNIARTLGNLPVRPERATPPQLGTSPDRPRTPIERVLAMREAPIFKRCSVEALIAITRSSHEVRYAPGEALWHRGEGTSFWVIVEYGHVRCTGEPGEEVTVGAGFVLGIMGALASIPRPFEARAVTEVSAYRIDVAAFLGVLAVHHDLGRDMVAQFAANVLASA